VVPKFQVATACFSCNPPDFNSSQLQSLQAASEVIQQMKETALTIGLHKNVDKTKYMNTSEPDSGMQGPGQWILKEKYMRK
jgi:hypothetical protein